MNEKDLLELYGLMESDPNMKGAFTVETLSSALSSESGAKEIHSYLEGRSDTKGAFGDFKSLMITPQKKSPSGSPSQGGLQGSQDGITAPSGGIEVPTAALPGLGGVEPQTQDRMGVIGQSLERGPKEDIGQYFLEGQPVSRSRMMNALKDRSFMESIAQGAGRDRIDIRNDQALLEFAQRQFESRKTNDTWDSLMLSVARGGQMVLGAVEYADDLVSELTGIPNTIYTLVGAAASPQMAAKGASGEIKKGVGELIDKFQQDASTAEERRFKVEEDFIALVSEGNVSEAVNMAINTTVESAVPSLMIGLGTLATGGGAGIAAIARGGAAVTPFFIGGEYVEQEQMAEDAREGLADPEKSVSLEQLKIMNLRGAAKYLRPALRGSAEMGGEAISFGLWKGSAKIAAQSMKSLVKGTASSLGEEAAKEVAETGAKELWKRMFESVVKAPLTEGFAEFSTFAAQELTDTLLGISAKSPARIMREGLNAWALGAASGGVMSAPGGAATSIALSAKGLKAAKSYLDDVIAFDPQGLEELNEAVNIMRKRGQEQQASAIEENLAKREKAVKAVPKDKVSDTETVDTVQEIQELEEQKKGLLPVWQEPIQAEIDAKTEKLKEGIAATPAETSPAETTPTGTVEQIEDVALAEVAVEGVQEGAVEVKSFKKGEGGTAGVLEGKDGKLYKSAVPHRRDIINGKVEIVPVEGKETQEHKFLSENQDMKHLPKVGKVVETSQGKAFEIEKLNEVEKGSLTLDEINQIQETITELNNRGVEVADNNTVMRRDNGDIVLIDLSNAQERNKNDIGETVSSNVVELLSKNDQTRYLANEQSKQIIEELTLFDEAPKPKTEFTYLLTQRPPSIGTHPIGQTRDAEEITLEDGKRKAYKITYDKPLSPEEIKQYELTEDVTMNDVGRVFEKTSGRTLVSKLITNVSDKGVSVTTFLGGKAKSETMSRRRFQREIDGYSETSQSNKQTPTKTAEQTEEAAPAEAVQPIPPTDAVQEQSTESVPVRQQPEARQGVREEDTQGQETPQEGEAVQEEVTLEADAKQELVADEILMSGEAQKRRQEGKYEKDGIIFERNPEKDGPKGSTGNVRFAQGEQEMPFTFRLVEADELQPSHINGRRNPLHFLPEAQPKTRDDAASIKSEDDIAANPRLDLVGEDTGAYSGAPVVNKRGEVVQGNNRAAGLKKTYQRNNPSYKQQLAERAGEFGLTKEQVEGMKNPVLVREVAFSDDAAIKFGNYKAGDLETGGEAEIEPVTVSARMPLEAKQSIIGMMFSEGDGTLKAAIKDNFKRAAEIVFPYLNAAQRNSLTKTTTPSPGQIAKMEGIVLQFLFDGGDPNLSSMFNQLSPTQKAAVLKAAPSLFSVTRDKSLVPEVQSAIGALNAFYVSGIADFDTWTNQSNIFIGGLSPKEIYTPTEILFAKTLAEASKQDALKDVVKPYSELVKGTPETLFAPATEGLTKEEALKKQFNDDTGGKKAVGAATPTMAPKKTDAKADKPTRKPRESKPSKPKVEPTEKTETQKLLEEKMAERKALADRIRNKKIGGVSFADPLFGAIGISKTLYDGALELAAKQVEKGTKIGTAIANAIKYIDERMAGKKWDKGLFGRHLNDQFKMMVNGKEVEVKRDLSEETLEVVNGWYSPLEKTIKDTKADSLTAKEWLDRVRSKEGEDMWTGLRGMLEAKSPKDRVSKRELLNYLKDNRVDVVEVVKGSEKDVATGVVIDGIEISKNEKGEYDVYFNGGLFNDGFATEREALNYVASNLNNDISKNGLAEIRRLASVGEPSKFSQYQLEGEKTNYKEVLVVIPRTGVMQKVGDYTVPYAHTYGEDLADNRRLVHLRMNTRKDADGNKVLFLEEVQSDWGQKGKREGFKSPELKKKAEAANKAVSDFYNSLKDKYGKDLSAKITDAESAKMDRLIEVRNSVQGWDPIFGEFKDGAIPSAPFVTDTNSWVKLGVKVALKEAVAQGVDRIAWTTGEQQNERYSLDKVADEVRYKRNSDGTYSVNAYMKGESVSKNDGLDEGKLEETLGKDVAQRIKDNVGEDIEGEKSLTGENLKIEGKGMKGFYGSPKEGSKGILGSVMEAVTGQEVDGISLDTGDAKYDAEKYNGSQNISSIPGNDFIKKGDWIIKDPNGDFIWSEDGNVSKSKAIENFKEASEEAGTPVSEGSGVVTQPSISITPELRSAVEKGQPLFGTYNVELAKAIRDKKIEGGFMFADPTGGFVALSAAIYNKAVDIIADQVEKGTSLGKAVQSAIEYIDSVMGGKKWDRKAFKEDFMGVEAQQTAPEKAPKKQPSEKASERQSQKRYTTRVIKNLEKLADKKELLEAVRETGTKESVISWKSLHPIALEMVEDIFSDPKSVNEKMKELSDVIDNTTNRNYRENKPLSTLHALIYHIAIDRLANEGMTQEYKIWVSAFQDLGRSKGQFNSAMQEAASSYAVKNLVVRPVFDADMEKLNEKAEDGETRAKHVEDVKELYDAILQSDELIELLQKRVGELEGQVEYYRDTQRPEASQPLDRKRQLKKEKDEALQMIRRGLAKARGQANVGIPINEDLINGTIALAKYYVKVGIYKAADLKKMVMKEVVDPSKDNPDMILQVADAIDSYLASDEFKDSRKEAMKAAFVDALESRAKAMMGNERATRKSAEQVLLDSLLSKLASDIGKDAKKGSKAYEQRLREALENADFSDSVWKAAMENVRIWMNMQDIAPTTKAEILSRLEDTASAFMEKPFAKSDIRKAIREGEKDLGTSLADVVKRHFTEQNSTLKTLAEKLVSELGLSAEAAKKYEQAIIEEARSYMNDKRMSAIQKALGVDSAGMPKEKAKKVNKAIVDRMIEGVNLGMLDDDLFRGMFAEKYGLIDPTPEMVANINRFNDLIHLHEGTDVSRRYKKELMDYIETLKPWNVAAFAKLTQGLVIKNMLNGLATFLNISAGSMYSFFTGIGPSVLMNIPATKAFFDEYSRAGLSSSSRRMFKDIMIDGRNPIDEGLGGKFDDGEVTGDRFEYFVKEYDVKKLRETFANAKTPKEVGTATLIAAARAFSLISQLSNFAKAFDVLLSNRGTEFEMFLKYYNEMSKEAGHPLRARFDPSVSKQFIDRLREKMAYDPDARAEIEASVDEQIAGMKARGEKVGAATRQVLIREGMVARRDMKEYRQAMDRVRSYLLMEDPNGLLGQMYDTQRGWGTIRGDEGAAKALAKLGYSLTFGLFLRISITATQRSIENIPVAGLLTPGFLYDYTRTDPSDPRSPKKWMGMFERKGGELVKNEMYDHKAMKRRLAVHAMIAGITVAAGWNMFVLKEVEDEEEDEEGNIKTVKKTRLDLNPDRVIEFTAHSGEFFKAEQFSGLDTQGSIDRRRDYYFRVKIGGKWENVAPTRLNPYFLFPTAVLGGIADDITLGMSKNERKRDAILNTWDDLAMGLAEFSFAGNAKLIRNTIYATQRGGVLEGAAEVGEFVLKPARVAIYPNALRDVYKEMRAIQGQEEKYGEGMLGALSNDIPVLEDMVGISSYDIFGYPKKVTSKFIQVGTDIPVAGIFIDNVIDHKYRNEERFDTDAWKLKMTYFPDVEIQGYWPKNTKNVTVTREMKNEASKVYGEFMRSAIEATPKDVWETLSQGDIDRAINGRIMSDGSRKGSGIHHAAVEVAKASIGISEMGKLAEIENSVRTELKEVREKSVQTEADEAMKSYLVDALQTISDVRKQLEQKTKK